MEARNLTDGTVLVTGGYTERTRVTATAFLSVPRGYSALRWKARSSASSRAARNLRLQSGSESGSGHHVLLDHLAGRGQPGHRDHGVAGVGVVRVGHRPPAGSRRRLARLARRPVPSATSPRNAR